MTDPAARHPDPTVRELARAVGRLTAAIAGDPRPAVGVDTWLPPAELGQMIGKNGKTVRRYITDHGLQAKKLPGGAYLIRYGDFIAWRGGEEESVREIGEVVRKLGAA